MRGTVLFVIVDEVFFDSKAAKFTPPIAFLDFEIEIASVVRRDGADIIFQDSFDN